MQQLLIACYRSGQINERQWQEHLKEDPKLRILYPELGL